MALTVENANLVKQRTFVDLRQRHIAEQMKAFWNHINASQNPDLQFVYFSGLETADKVVADVACKLYAIFMRKPTASTVDSWLKASDHASAAGVAGDVVVKLVGTSGGGREYVVTFPNGLLMATGVTIGAHTTVGAAGKSLVADAATGWAIVGAS